ncbi:MAG TPA: GntR family transcriptional regulator [Longimicrobiaceae bacterium]|nr:GntR family transcriptional regulator [Longimicrobiaceae bacterium]
MTAGPPPPRWTPPPRPGRSPVREEAYRLVHRRLARGQLAPGTRVSDTALAGELGLGRTAVREALVRLEREGMLRSQPGHGFFVAPLSADQLRQAAPLLWTLEALALRLAFPLPPHVLDELDALNDRAVASTGDPSAAVGLNLRWHHVLVRGCPNARLRAEIDALAHVLRRHAHAYWRHAGRLRATRSMHAAVAQALRAGDLPGAVTLLERGWTDGVIEMAAWLDAGADAPG